MDRCERVRRVCGDAARLYDKLQAKRELVAQYFVPRRHTRKYSVLLQYAYKLFDGHMQNVYLSAPRPPERVIRRMILDSFPALITCIHARYYCDRGLEHNYAFMIVGPGGVGKTTYVTYLAAYLGGVLLTSEDDILYGLREMIRKREWTPLLILDDIGAIMSKYWVWLKEERAWLEFFKMIDYAKDLTTTLLVTARTEEGPPKRLREIVNYTGFVRVLPAGSSLVYFVEWYSGTKMAGTPVAVDVWWPGLRLPEKLWKRIKEVRKLRSEILVIETTLKMAEAGRIALTEEQAEEMQQKLEELRSKLREIGRRDLLSELLEEET